ncbi:MAG: C-GCAxxG-C-C family protein [bacterium]
MSNNKTKDALNSFDQGYSCSQAVFSAYSEDLGLDKKTAFKVSAAFGGGIARTGETCGVISGALMVIGHKYGKVDVNDQTSKEKTYLVAKEFINRFTEKHKNTRCNDLLGYDITTQDGLDTIKKKDLHSLVCKDLVKDAIEILDSVLKEYQL